MPNHLDTHYKMVIKAITDGRVVPFLGADVTCAITRPRRIRNPAERCPSLLHSGLGPQAGCRIHGTRQRLP